MAMVVVPIAELATVVLTVARLKQSAIGIVWFLLRIYIPCHYSAGHSDHWNTKHGTTIRCGSGHRAKVGVEIITSTEAWLLTLVENIAGEDIILDQDFLDPLRQGRHRCSSCLVGNTLSGSGDKSISRGEKGEEDCRSGDRRTNGRHSYALEMKVLKVRNCRKSSRCYWKLLLNRKGNLEEV